MDYKDYKLKGQNVVDIPFVCYIIYLRFRSNILANILLLLAEQQYLSCKAHLKMSMSKWMRGLRVVPKY